MSHKLIQVVTEVDANVHEGLRRVDLCIYKKFLKMERYKTMVLIDGMMDVENEVDFLI